MVIESRVKESKIEKAIDQTQKKIFWHAIWVPSKQYLDLGVGEFWQMDHNEQASCRQEDVIMGGQRPP
jgi:hypothetical protein